MAEHLHELPEVNAVVGAVGEEGVHDAIDQRINGQLRDAQKVLARQRSTVAAVERREARVEPLDLAGRDYNEPKPKANILIMIVFNAKTRNHKQLKVSLYYIPCKTQLNI